MSWWVIVAVAVSPCLASGVMLFWSWRKLEAARRCHAAADLAFVEAGMKNLMADAKIERAESLMRYARNELRVAREYGNSEW